MVISPHNPVSLWTQKRGWTCLRKNKGCVWLESLIWYFWEPKTGLQRTSENSSLGLCVWDPQVQSWAPHCLPGKSSLWAPLDVIQKPKIYSLPPSDGPKSSVRSGWSPSSEGRLLSSALPAPTVEFPSTGLHQNLIHQESSLQSYMHPSCCFSMPANPCKEKRICELCN